ncbi:NADH-quinone oxidoreductase subunit F [Platysternon megacephalum]|uniref:NADH-quinone oxidoreductase subunit F n=1 Tax=Platysternon megacephalum TaxID=55544 RepID=A0A4D9DDQ0_9SAUR|nr:NADH-quinone oxidoreductase subunit F [Platysternon megacephalum]
MAPGDIVETVKSANLRGRGGAGFPTGLKWSFLPKDNPNPTYLVVNADESEPGTCKDIPLMMASPHTLVEGVIISSFAIGAHHAFIYVRGEVLHVIRRLQQAVAEACEAGYAGDNVLGTGYPLQITVHAGAGAYICGEETALLDSLEGRRAPRSSTTSNPLLRYRSSSAKASGGSTRWGPKSPRGRASSPCRATSRLPANTKHRSVSRCASCWNWAAVCAMDTN